MNVVFPWPPRELSPNARVHHMVKARAVKAYRTDCAWLAVCAVTAQKPALGEEIKIAMEFWPPNKRKRDLDNCLASCKALLDGLAQALKVDDSRFHLSLKFGPSGGKPGTVGVSVS